MPIKCPCMNCPKSGCGAFHDECKVYATYRAEISRINEAKRKMADECVYTGEAARRMRKA